jgi:hypothetical protein
MLGRLITIGLVCFLLGAGAVMFFGPLVKTATDARLPACPYAADREFASLPPEVVAATGAYEVIRETLQRESLDGVAAQAGVIARSFADFDPKISSLAKRLAAEQDVASAKRAFMRLHRLMEKHAQKLPAA